MCVCESLHRDQQEDIKSLFFHWFSGGMSIYLIAANLFILLLSK